jgi:hypothetical protein
MASSGTRYRLPRKVKKAQAAYYGGTVTAKQLRLLRRCLVIGGWKTVRRQNAHVAMGSTVTARTWEKVERKLFHNS